MMLQRVTERMAFFLLKEEILQEKDFEWCIYLFQKWIFTVATSMIIFLIGLLIASPIQILVYHINFLILRKRSGGYHAKTPLRCLGLSIVIELNVLLIARQIQNSLFMNIFIFSLSIIILWFVFPVKQDENREEMIANKKILRKIAIVEIFVFVCFICSWKSPIGNNVWGYWNLGNLVVALSLITSKWRRENGKEKELESNGSTKIAK